MAAAGAKNHSSKVVQSARTQGPQIVTLRGERAAVVLWGGTTTLSQPAAPMSSIYLSGPPSDDELAEAVDRRARTPSRNEAF